MYSALQLFFDTCKSKELQGCLDRSTVAVLNNKDKTRPFRLMHCTDRRRLRNKRDKKPAISSQLVGELSYPGLNISISHIVLCENASDDLTTINNFELNNRGTSLPFLRCEILLTLSNE